MYAPITQATHYNDGAAYDYDNDIAEYEGYDPWGWRHGRCGRYCRTKCGKCCKKEYNSKPPNASICCPIEPYKVTYLISNVYNQSCNLDVSLVNPWGIVITNNILWVANNGTGMITTYNLEGNKLPTNIFVFNNVGNPALVTGLVHNSTNGFIITNGTAKQPSFLIVASQDGTISAYNSAINLNTAILVVNNSAKQSVYTGITILDNYLYAADFYNNKIDVFDSNFVPVTVFPFIDQNTLNPLPANFAPYNIKAINNLLYVSYAQQNPPTNQTVVPGLGNGYISVFNSNGMFIKRLISNSQLNAPWGMVTNGCGNFLIGNFGDGYINEFNGNGTFLGKIRSKCRNYIRIDGLRSLINSPCNLNRFYLSAGPTMGTNGLAGILEKC